MKKMVILLIGCVLYPLLAASSPAGPEPGDREITGSHISSTTKKGLPERMALVPSGKIQMGMSSEDAYKLIHGQKDLLDIFSRSTPKSSQRTTNDFFCDIYEVTNAQWKLYLDCTGQKPSQFLVDISWKKMETFPEGEANFPVRNVSLNEARAYTRWCGKRIPTEVEWHRAAAGDDGRIYTWGMEWNRNLFEAFRGYKRLRIKFGKKWINSEPRFNVSQYVIKGGCYFLDAAGNRLEVREMALSTDNLNTLGFRCVKDVQPGKTMLLYAIEDLRGSVITDKEFDERNIYAMEITELTDTEPKLISGFSSMLVCPMGKSMTTTAKIIKDSPNEPFPIGVISTNAPIEEPNLPPGSYVLAYRNAGLSDIEKAAALAKEEAEKKKKEAEAAAAKKAEEEKKAEKEKEKKKGEDQEKPKTQEEIEAEKKRLEEEEAWRKAEEDRIRENKLAEEAEKRLGIAKTTKEHIPFPRDKNLILFMNANDTVVGYIEVDGFKEESTTVPIHVAHSPDTGLTSVEMGVMILLGKSARFNFNMKIMDNPF
jgi:formylglycine-generating enzyme required for sulfatase activity